MFQTRYATLTTLTLTTLALLCLALHAHADSPNAEQIFPDATKGFLAIKNLKNFNEQWNKTQFGKLMSDPLMENFKKELQKQFSERSEKTFGLAFDDILSLPSGEVAIGMIAIPNQIPGYVLTMDVAGKRPETNDYLARLAQKLTAVGVKKSTETYKDQQITILVFPPADKPPVLTTTRGTITFDPVERRAHYMFFQDVLIASDQIHLLKLIADRIAGQTGKPLAEVEGYQVVMKRCLSDIPHAAPPDIRWYIEPLDYGESIRVLLRNSIARSRRDKPSIFSVLKQQGFDALVGVGGTVSVKTEAQESVYRTFVYTRKPYRLAMQMLNFPDQTDFAPPDWMPNDLARCTMLYVDPIAIFDNVGVLFDAFTDDVGMWKGILEGLEKDPLGPKINLREELMVNLGSRVLGMSRYAKPITVKSESMVVAVELKPGRESAMLAGVEKLFGTDPEMTSTDHHSYKIWHRIPASEVYVPPVIEGPDIFGPSDGTGIPSLVSVETIPVAQRPANQAADEPPIFPEGGVVVAKGWLFLSTNLEYLTVILDRLDSSESGRTAIREESEYQASEGVFSALGLSGRSRFFQFFAKTRESLRPTYEMVRQGRMAQSQAVLGKALNLVLSPEDGSGIRGQVFDGSTLPEFDRVEHYFGTVGVCGASEEGGYFIKGFTLERGAR